MAPNCWRSAGLVKALFTPLDDLHRRVGPPTDVLTISTCLITPSFKKSDTQCILFANPTATTAHKYFEPFLACRGLILRWSILKTASSCQQRPTCFRAVSRGMLMRFA